MTIRPSEHTILGIDASLVSTGWAVRKGRSILAVGRIQTTNKIDEDHRLYNICMELIEIAKEHKITRVAMETQFFGKNAKTGLQLSRLRGAIAFAFLIRNVNIVYKTPSEVKQSATTFGNAEKELVADEIRSIYKDSPCIQDLAPYSDKANKNKTSDMYDAVAISHAVE